ncbi:hypothetical protein Hanom_Chr08g00694971 [Helianthus anomalus]
MSIRDPSFCRHMNRADEVLLAIPSDVACKLWGKDKAPTNVLIQSEDDRTFNVSLREAKGKHIFSMVDYTTFKVTYFIDGVSRSSFWTSLVSTTSHFSVIPKCILPKSYDYISNDIISTVNIGNKTFHVKTETVDGKVVFTNGIDHVVAPIDSIAAPAVDEQPHDRRYKFVRMEATYFRLPDNVSRMPKLDFDLKPITVRLLHPSPQKEFINGTRREKKDKGFRYALTRWSRFIEICWH